MDVRLFDYDLPSGYISQEPLKKRDNSQLLILNKDSGEIKHRQFSQIIDFFQSGDLLVLNNSKVLPMRLYGNKKNSGGSVEALLISKSSGNYWKALLRPGKRIHIGTEIVFSSELEGTVVERDETEGIYLIKMHAKEDFYDILYKIGIMPTPPYIKKKLVNPDFYQTVYAKKEGSIAAPTAGFHFTEELLDRIEKKGVEIIFLTLHIGRGTFEMIKVDNLEEHKMKPELFTISPQNAEIINKSLENGRRIVGVGTSVTRALESSVIENKIFPGTRWTDLFIYPGFRFQAIKALITNFHLPKSTPLMLASALTRREFLLNAYKEAIKKNYRFYSFGDAMLIL